MKKTLLLSFYGAIIHYYRT